MKPRGTALAAAVIALAAAAPAEAARLFAVTQTPTRQVIAFDSSAPGTILSSAPIAGLLSTEVIKGVDLRPATGEVILLTRTRLHRLDPTTGATSQPISLSSPLGSATEYGVDVDPVEDNLRVVGSDGSNRTVDLATGQVATHTDSNVEFIDALAYFSDGRLLAYASDAGGQDGFGGRDAASDEDDGLYGPFAAETLGADGGNRASSAMDVVDEQVFVTAVKAGVQRLFAGTALVTPTEVGPVAGNPDVRGMTAVDNLVRLMTPVAGGAEGDSASVVIARESPRGTASVGWSAQAGTASAGSDFSGASGTIAFGAGETAKTLTIALPEDDADEPDETFEVTLTGATNGAPIVGARTATITVFDDDAPATPQPAPPVQVLVPFAIAPPVPVLLAGACTNPLRGGNGDDALIGTTAGDVIRGGAGADALVGRDGNDCLHGGAGNDWLNGAEGNDQLRGDSGEDFLLGGRGNDVMSGGNGDDRIVGGDGADTISGGGGSNRILGGSGNDRINARNGRRDVIDCGGGRDRVTIDIRRDKTRGCETIPGT